MNPRRKRRDRRHFPNKPSAGSGHIAPRPTLIASTMTQEGLLLPLLLLTSLTASTVMAPAAHAQAPQKSPEQVPAAAPVAPAAPPANDKPKTTTDQAKQKLKTLRTLSAEVTDRQKALLATIEKGEHTIAEIRKAIADKAATAETVAQVGALNNLLAREKPAELLKKMEASLEAGDDVAGSLAAKRKALKEAKEAVSKDITEGNFVGESDIAAANDAVAQADKILTNSDPGTLQKAVTDRLKSATDGAKNLPKAVLAVYVFADGLVTSLSDRVKATGLPALSENKTATPDQVRTTLARGLSALAAEEDLRRRLAAAWPALEKTLKEQESVSDPQTTDGKTVTERLAGLEAYVRSHAAQPMAGWVDAVNKAGKTQMDAVQKAVEGAQKARSSTPRDQAALAKMPIVISQTSDYLADLEVIERDGTDVVSGWKAVTEYIPLFVTPAGDALERFKSTRLLLGSANGILAESISDDRSRFVHDQIRLFYNTDVLRILKAINPNTTVVNMDSIAAQSAAAKARADLLRSDAEIASSVARLNDLTARLREVDEAIRLVNARAEAATRRQQQAQVGLLNIQARQQILAKEREQQTAKKDAENATAAQKQAAEEELKRIAEEETILTTRKEAQESVVTDATKGAEEARAEQSRLRDEQADLPRRRREAREAVSNLQADLSGKRQLAARLAQEEAELFGVARDNQPFWFGQAIAGSTDPHLRVLLYGYNDSKTIFLRGNAEDVERVKEAIAAFDRPAPQARVNLWTLQISGQDTGKINLALREVDERLRSLRGSTTLIQDMLRNAIGQEVNRIENISNLSTIEAEENTPGRPPRRRYSGRLGRYFYYPREFRRSLGFYFSLPDVPEWSATYLSELELVRKYYHQARVSHIAVLEYKDRDAKKKHRSDREVYLRRTRYHYLQAGIALAQLERADTGRQYTSDISRLKRDLKTYVEKAEDFAALVRQYANEATADDLYTDFFEVEERKNHGLKVYYPSTPSLTEQNVDTTLATASALLEKTSRDACLRANDDWERFLTPDEYNDAEHLTRWTLPDPAGATTLGEMLFVLSLGERRSRKRILDNFLLQIDALSTLEGADGTTDTSSLRRFGKAIVRAFGGADSVGITGNASNREAPLLYKGGVPLPGYGSADTAPGGKEDPFYPYFPRTIFGSVADRVPEERSNQELTANQKEIQSAILTKVRENVAGEIRHLIRSIGGEGEGSPNQSASSARLFRNQYISLVAWLHSSLFTPNDPNQTLSPQKTWYALGRNILPQNGLESDRAAWTIATLAWSRNSLSRATPRVAAADDMIKRMIQVAENDLEHYLVQDELDKLRNSILGAGGLQMGTVQKESVLATNRLIARVDPQANVDVLLQGETQLANSAQQLASIIHRENEVQRAGKLAETAPLAAAGLYRLYGAEGNQWQRARSSFGVGVVASLLGNLLARPQEPAGEVYSINSGNLFKITPIFDPSGQAMRFKFDYTATTRVTEPDGTVNRQIPRIERHTVNTEVGLTNLEFREVSSFETNTKLGHPEQRTGGLPLLNQLPVFKDIPIIGYYSRRGGSAGVRQHSIIFAQTSMYPTVGDIIGLMTDVPPRPDLQRGAPKYLAQKLTLPAAEAGAADSPEGAALTAELSAPNGGKDYRVVLTPEVIAIPVVATGEASSPRTATVTISLDRNTPEERKFNVSLPGVSNAQLSFAGVAPAGVAPEKATSLAVSIPAQSKSVQVTITLDPLSYGEVPRVIPVVVAAFMPTKVATSNPASALPPVAATPPVKAPGNTVEVVRFERTTSTATPAQPVRAKQPVRANARRGKQAPKKVVLLPITTERMTIRQVTRTQSGKSGTTTTAKRTRDRVEEKKQTPAGATRASRYIMGRSETRVTRRHTASSEKAPTPEQNSSQTTQATSSGDPTYITETSLVIKPNDPGASAYSLALPDFDRQASLAADVAAEVKAKALTQKATLIIRVRGADLAKQTSPVSFKVTSDDATVSLSTTSQTPGSTSTKLEFAANNILREIEKEVILTINPGEQGKMVTLIIEPSVGNNEQWKRQELWLYVPERRKSK